MELKCLCIVNKYNKRKVILTVANIILLNLGFINIIGFAINIVKKDLQLNEHNKYDHINITI